MDSIVIIGEVPSKKNSRIINTKTKKSFPGKRYAEWHDNTVMQLVFALNRRDIHKVPHFYNVIYFVIKV